jgi:hypothetical protein
MTAPTSPAVPPPPHKPDPLECCERGCCPCIFDYYWDALDRWKATVRKLGHDPDQLLALQSAG